jgi:MFS family permease
MYFGVIITGYATSFFIPTIIKDLGFTTTGAQVRGIPIFMAATVCSITAAWFTDKFKHRYAFIILGVTVATVGYIILLNTIHVSTGVRYFACFLITCGGYIAQPIVLVWLSNNESGHYKRAFSSSIQVAIGNSGGIVASNIFLPNQEPVYPVGYGVALGCMLFCGIVSTVFYVMLKRENALRERGGRDYRLRETDSKEVRNLGDDHPSFRFSF